MVDCNSHFEHLREVFRSYFEKEPYSYERQTDRFNGGDGWEYAVVKGSSDTRIHYELIRRGQEFYVELHVENHPRNVSCWHALQKRLAEDNRHFIHYTYYSSNYWRTRTPLYTEDELCADLKHITEVVESVFTGDSEALGLGCHDADLTQDLPFQRDPKYVAKMLGDNGVLRMPAVQRGRVWNAARIEALWDSILRGFSIGAFSVQKLNDRLDLLDGQQRSTAIALAYSDFPPAKEHELDPVLWLDLNPEQSTIVNSQKRFMVYVTTASQPWGYASSSDETRNVLLSTQERRNALADKKWHDESEKPYPGELTPSRAVLPVPLNLLIRFAELDSRSEKTISGFVDWCKSYRKNGSDIWWNWLGPLSGAQETRAWKDFFQHKSQDGSVIPRAKQLAEFPVFFIDAGSVDENDVSLYFTRIGKGGVRPSDEELAFSVLKSKLGVGFKKTIDDISDHYGLAHPSRVAHLAIRCFNSTNGTFFGNGVLDAVLRMCKRGSDGDYVEAFRRFDAFVNGGEFERLIKEVDAKVFGPDKECLTQWHRNRFCSYHNGDIYLFLLLAIRDGFVGDIPLPALAELIFEKALNPDRTIRYIMSNGVLEGLALSMRETYRGVPRFGRIPCPKEFSSFENDAQSEGVTLSRLKDMAKDRLLYDLIANGYGNQKAYSMLLYACKEGYVFGDKSDYFGYNPRLGVWAEDNCPWDYDHILPHSWIDKMPSGAESDVCNWLKNSVGNLAPLPFVINRSLSDESRDSRYPYCNQTATADSIRFIQQKFLLDGLRIEEMSDFRSEDSIYRARSIRAFCLGTIARYCQIYQRWYDGLGVEKVWSCSNLKEWPVGLRRRRELLASIAAKWGAPKSVFHFFWHDNTERIIEGVDHQFEDWYVWSWLSVSHTYNDFSVEVTVNREFTECEFGVCKLPTETMTNDKVVKMLGSSIATLPVRKDGYWYAVKKICPQNFLDCFSELIEIEDECLKKIGHV